MIYGFGSLTLGGSEVCCSEFSFRTASEVFNYNYFNANQQVYLPANLPGLIQANRYLFELKLSVYDFSNLVNLLGGQVVNQLEFQATKQLNLTGIAYELSGQKIQIAATQLTPTNIGRLAVGEELLVNLESTVEPTIILLPS